MNSYLSKIIKLSFILSIFLIPKITKAEFQVGVIIPLSGHLAEFGVAIKNGIELAVQENTESNNKIKFIYEDSKYEKIPALAAFNKLVLIDKVNVMYVFGGPISAVLAPLAEKKQIPTFSTEYDPQLTINRQYVIRFANNATDYSKALLSEIRKSGAKNFALVKVENQYHNILAESFANSLSPGEKSQLIANVLPGESDFRSIILKLRSSSWDALGVYLTPGMQKPFFLQLKAAKLPIPVFGTDTFLTSAENRGVEEVVEGALFPTNIVSDTFKQTYSKTYGNDSQIIHAGLVNDFYKLLENYISLNQKNINSGSLFKYLETIKGQQGVTGNFKYKNSSSTGKYFEFPVGVYRVTKGSAELIAKY